jgi:hypothetical protein
MRNIDGFGWRTYWEFMILKGQIDVKTS